MPVIELDKLLQWLGVEGAIAGLEASDLTTLEIAELIQDYKPNGHSKMKRLDLIRAIVEKKRADITKKPAELIEMDADALKSYFVEIKASKKELLSLLESMDIRPGSVARHNLIEFAAREISDIGMYKRVAQGSKSIDVGNNEPIKE